ncbi:MAG: T9SS type A sorting domain-containing protein [Candidatus Edwardsbacteria bacterium]|jgi:hypothetical protein|nr:T9SS type A sorting domain-containing protein [Candidatus Edwardsbacteria bacterium]
MRTYLLVILSLVVVAGVLSAQPTAVVPNGNQTTPVRWGSNVQVTDRPVYDFDVDYRANGEMWLSYITGNTNHDTLYVCSSGDGGLTWTAWIGWMLTGDGRKFTDVNIVCGDTLLYVFMPADTAAGVYRDYVVRLKYNISANSWLHFAAGTATGIIDEIDADRSGLPGDTIQAFYHTTSAGGMSLVHSYDFGATWTSGLNFGQCSSPAVTWIRSGDWAAVYRYNPSGRNTVYRSYNSGQNWSGWSYLDTVAANDTLNRHLSISACHGTGQVMVATDWESGDATWMKELRVYCASDGGNTEFANAFAYQFSGDQGLPVVNCLRFGGNDWGNLAYCDYGYSADSIRYAYDYQGGVFSSPEIVSDRPGAGAATPLQPKIAYCDDGSHPGPAIFYAGADRQGLYMNAGWITGVAGRPEHRISKYELRMGPNRPNPFKQWTTIDYQLPMGGLASLKVFNVAGQLVRTLVDGAQLAGSHAARWDGRDDRGREVGAGVYLCRLSAGTGTATRKLTVVR